MVRMIARSRVRLQVGVLRNGKRETAHIEDVSEGGLKLGGVIDPKVGEVLQLHSKGAFFSARIRWVDGTTCGLQYLNEHNAGDLRRFLSTLPGLTNGKTRGRQVFREIGFRPDQVSRH